MGTIRLPRYLRPIKGAGGKIRYYWEPPSWARPTRDPKTGRKIERVRHGVPCPVQAEKMGDDLAVAITRATVQNEALDAWRKGKAIDIAPGSVDWLFTWYQGQARYTSKSAKTRRDYRHLMDRLAREPMKVGTLGQRKASAVNAAAADRLYARWRTKYGERQATYAMQVCRLVWNWAVRHHDKTGVTFNPFAKMALTSTASEGNRPTTRAEYDLYRAKAHELGFHSMATAAALSFELCQRVWDVFGFEDEDGVKKRGFIWADYQPGVSIAYSQSKTGKPMMIPLSEMIDGERVLLFPTLEEELALAPRKALVMVVHEKTGMPLTYQMMRKRHRKICVEAGLPREMTFTGFRHGGSTELGDAGVADIRPITGHLQLNTTAIYNKVSQEKARQAAAIRLEYVRRLSENVSESASENASKIGSK